MSQKVFKYSNGELTVIWQPEKCQHTAICFHGLPTVFDPKKRPWVDALQADTSTIISQIKKCPSGALSFLMDEHSADQKIADIP